MLGQWGKWSTGFRFDGFCWSNCGDDGGLTCDRCVFNRPNRQCCGVDYDHYDYDDYNNFYHHNNDGCTNNVNDFNDCCTDNDCGTDDYCGTDNDCCSSGWR